MIPLPHQQRVIKANKPKSLLDWSPRVGKTLPASIWVDLPEQAGNTYIICKKSNKKEWVDLGTKATVMTKEEFKKHAHGIKNPTAIVCDECHHFGSALFVKGRSQLAGALYNLLKDNPDCHFMGLSGSMVRNSPWSFHTLLCYMGVYIPWKIWQTQFFELKFLPYLPRPAYFPKENWRQGVYLYRAKYCDQVSLSDVVDYLPPVKPEVVNLKPTVKYKKPIDEVVTWTHEHRHEQSAKAKWLIDMDYKKIIVVCRYTEQIESLATILSEYKPVYILNGATKDQGGTIKQAQMAEECYFLVNTKIGEGWEGYMFDCMVFASMDDAFVANFQMHERQRNIKNLKDIEIFYLIGGPWDKKIYESYEEGNDFNPHKYVA